jgi:SAM-dependent methyltransferase
MENLFNLGTWEEFVTKSFKQLGYGDFQQVFSAGKSLDIGCGSGYLTGGLQAMGIDAYGIDPDRESIEYGKRTSLLRYTRRNLIVASMVHLPFKAEKFHTITSCNIADVVNDSLGTRIPFPREDKPRAVDDIYRVLEKGGLYIAFDENAPFDMPPDMELRIEYPSREHAVLRLWEKR